MLQPEHDPFFEQLKKEIEEAILEADQGKLVPEKEVWKHFRALSRAARRERRGPA